MIVIELQSTTEWADAPTDWPALALKCVEAAARAAGHAAMVEGHQNHEISVRLTDDEEIRALNARWRGKDQPTNVLSFPMLDADELAVEARGNGGIEDDEAEIMLGDLVLAHGVCAREAAERNVSLAAHAQHLIVHGVLHLLGHDHMTDDDAEAMESLECAIMGRLGLHDPYAEAS